MYFLVLTSYKLLKRVLIHFSDKIDSISVKEILLVALVDDGQFTFNTVRISHIELILNTCLWTLTGVRDHLLLQTVHRNMDSL